jgi:5-oxoprolinase (ATP-hydrolysing)
LEQRSQSIERWYKETREAAMSRESNSRSDSKWHFWIDRGGTFTDVVARRPDGRLITHKLLSENPARYPDAALQGIRDVLQIPADAPIPAERIAGVKVGTTVATNALLERKGEPCVLVTTKGFRDALRIGYQNRPKLFALHIELPELLYDQVIEVDERVGADGTVYRALDVEQARAGLEAVFEQGVRAAAVVFMHGYRYTDHERRAAALARDIGFTQVSVSHEVSPLMKLVGRGDTTVVDAYLSPLLRRYVDRLRAELKDTPLYFMQSNGGLADAAHFQGRDAILSGPAGGIVGAVRTAEQAGFDRIIGFDMGGTSTDVTHYAGAYERSFEAEVAGVRLRVPMMHIHTIAAGGGSKLVFDGARFRVGPESAGAYPGPACYRNGGPLTLTDCHVMLGRIAPGHFPQVFGPNGDEPLDADVVARKFAELAQDISAATGKHHTPEQVVEGFLAVAVENMARAIKKISTERGHDVSRYTLVCFGGAGGQHACRVADQLGMTRIMVHPLAGVLSAFGMGLADLRSIHEQAIEAELAAGLMPRLEHTISILCEQGLRSLQAQGVPRDQARTAVTLRVRYRGSDTPLPVPYATQAEIRSRFETAHRRLYGFREPDKALIVEAVSVEVAGGGSDVTIPDTGVPSEQAASVARVFIDGEYRNIPLLQRGHLAPGEKIPGPAIILESHGTLVV